MLFTMVQPVAGADTVATPAYSICITNYNTVATIRESLESLLCQLDDSFEVIVCDNLSTDGSNLILEDYALKGKIKLIKEKSNRGQGRQIAYEHSCAPIIISGLDLDDIFKPTLKDILGTYHAEHEGFMWSLGTVHIIPRAIIEEVGGWRDLHAFEDKDFAQRVELIGKLHYVSDSTAIILNRGIIRGQFGRLREEYIRGQIRYRMGFRADRAGMLWYERIILSVMDSCAVLSCKLRRVQKLDY